jgi:DNA-binding winged helix-turn-helix (wHTH) protein/TolB-like protein
MSGRLRFGPFLVDPASGELWREGARLQLQDLPFRLLAALLERPGELWTREELTTRLWGAKVHVDAVAGLNTAVAKLREALGDDAERPAYVETVSKRGYRFIGRLEPVEARRRVALWGALAVGALAVAGVSVLSPSPTPKSRIAVVLFDNETDDPALERMAQGLTDATVFALAGRPELEVIGNAAVLRTERPFRDLEKVRDAVGADFIVIGQVQALDRALNVRAHLIRARDLAHVWVDNFPATAGQDAALQADVAGRVTAAVTKSTSVR